MMKSHSNQLTIESQVLPEVVVSTLLVLYSPHLASGQTQQGTVNLGTLVGGYFIQVVQLGNKLVRYGPEQESELESY